MDSDTPMREDSRDRGNGGSPHGHANLHSETTINGYVNGNTSGKLSGSGKQSRAKTHPARTSMNEMKRRVAAILEFVGMMQTKANGTTSTSGKDTPSSNTSAKEKGVDLPVAGLIKAVQAATQDMGGEEGQGSPKTISLKADGEFRDLGSGDMMEALTKELVSWQGVYGVWSR